MLYQNKVEMIKSCINNEHVVLDIGFMGQGKRPNDSDWLHRVIVQRAKKTYGIDLQPYIPEQSEYAKRYTQQSAESFNLDEQFDVIFAGDLIEHLVNPGSFLDSCKSHLAEDGRLIITTPNTFNLFNLAEKITKDEPTVNSDHTCYFNKKTLTTLLKKCGWEIISFDYIYSLELHHPESWKKRALNMLYKLFSLFTNKFIETLVVTAIPFSHKNKNQTQRH